MLTIGYNSIRKIMINKARRLSLEVRTSCLILNLDIRRLAMSKKGIWLLQETTPEQLEMLTEIAPDYELIKGWGNQQTDFPSEDIEILYGWNKKLCSPLLEIPNSNLRWIQAQSAGVDYMDIDFLKRNHILLTNGSGIHAIPISESVFGMLFSFTRGIQKSIKDQSNKNWDRNHQIMELHGRTIMIVGTGQIGTQVGKIAKAFGMKTIGVNRSGMKAENMDIVITQQNIGSHLPEADIVVDILPLTDLTRYFFNKDIFSQMKDGSIFINVGRGPTVNTADLIDALIMGRLSFAGLDVFEEEPLPAESTLWAMENVLITPHISGLARHFKKRLFEIFSTNLKAYVKGEDLPRNKIDFDRYY